MFIIFQLIYILFSILLSLYICLFKSLLSKSLKKLVWLRDLLENIQKHRFSLTFVNKLLSGIIIYLEEDADAQVHEGFGEVDDALPGVVDGHGGDCQVGALQHQNTATNHDKVAKNAPPKSTKTTICLIDCAVLFLGSRTTSRSLISFLIALLRTHEGYICRRRHTAELIT